MNITNLFNKIKRINSSIGNNLNGEVGTIMVIILIGFVGFGLGRLSSLESKKQPITITSQETKENRNQENNKASVIQGIEDGGFIVASKNGTKYHYPWCSGAKRTKERNKVYFKSIEEARKAGYTPAGNCKGLK